MWSGRGPGVLLVDRLGDHRGVGGKRAGVVGHDQRAAGGGDVLDPLDLAAEPVVVEERVERLVEQLLDPLGAAPVGDRALGLDGGQVVAQVRRGRGGRECGRVMRARAPAGARARASRRRRSTSSVSQISRFQGCSSVAARMPASSARSRLRGRVVHEQVDADLRAVGDLVERAVELVVGEADPVEPGGRPGLAVRRPVRGDVDEVAGLVPRADRLHRPRIGLGGQHVLLPVRLGHGGTDLLGAQQRDLPRDLVLVRQGDAEAAADGLRELRPVVVQGGVDVDRDLHDRPLIR